MAVSARLLFLDANILASPVTRTLLMVGSDRAGLRVTWSEHAETEANRHLPPNALSVSALRIRLGRSLGPTGGNASRYRSTDAKDRQILADAQAAGAAFIITKNVADFAATDLIRAGLAAVDPDLFMATRFDVDAYYHALSILVENLRNPPRSVSEAHALLARQHPRLVARHADLFASSPVPPMHNPPREVYRGARCVLCGRTVSSPDRLRLGVGPDCKRKI